MSLPRERRSGELGRTPLERPVQIFASESGGPSDLDVLLDVLVGANTDPEAVAKCSVSEGVGCTMLDAVLLEAALSQTPGVAIAPVCGHAVPPVVTTP